MARGGVAVDEVVECRAIGAGEATDRLLLAAAPRYRAVNVGASRFDFARSYRPTWALVLGVLTAPTVVGLLFFLVKSTEQWTATVEEDHRSVTVRLGGRILPQTVVAVRTTLTSGPAPAPAPPPRQIVVDEVVTPDGPSRFAPPLESLAPPGVAGAIASSAPPSGGTAIPPPVPTQLPPAPSGLPPLPPHLLPDPPGPSSVPPNFPPPPEVRNPTESDEEVADERTVLGGHVDKAGAEDRTADDFDRTTTRAAMSELRAAPQRDVVLSFDTGRQVELTGRLLVGRDPSSAGEDTAAQVLAVDGDGRSVSKTHAALWLQDGDVMLLDRGSTNGTAVRRGGAEWSNLEPGIPFVVRPGDVVRLGERTFTVDLRSGG